ncbi:Carboxypeptidase [Quillaja saponaria]|uniref:Serine carboxypeptidase 1 n=1 Tax=Quillaja saponaria TaxID=32244 RepID=A0AAD7PCV3_QUISA|nr:Carboxypeptidase [Quillaja saponaria]
MANSLFNIIFVMNTIISIPLCMVLNSEFLEAAPCEFLITQLPGFTDKFPSKHYSGYINIDGKNLFYYFVTSEKNQSNDPVVLWLNGGPACSSFDGFVYEHGPFNFEAGKQEGSLPILHLNPYSWSKVSNIIYLDSPAGTGLSYSINSSHYTTGDFQTASDTHAFLLEWFELFSEFVSNPFYISGESFAGIYIPTLASEIVRENGAKPTINFKGYMVGNGLTDDVFDGNALVPFVHGMALISDKMFEEAEAACKGKYYDPDESCVERLLPIYNVIEKLNFYDTLEPCYHKPNSSTSNKNYSRLPLSFQQLGMSSEKPLGVRKRMFGRSWPFRAPVRNGIVQSWPQILSQYNDEYSVPCTKDEVSKAWLNNEEVRKAIHAEPIHVSVIWELCTDRVNYTHDSGSMIPYHKNLTLQGYRVLIYSGDHDMCVPYTGNEAWTRSLGYKTVDEWRPWLTYDNQVSGYVQGYDNNLTFLTIKGAGHTVPEYKPREALDFYSRWLEGKPI